MAERIVLDTGPILALACADALNPIGDLPIDFVAPIEVRDELEEGVRRGYPAAAATWLRFAKLTAAVSPLAIAELDRGEASGHSTGARPTDPHRWDRRTNGPESGGRGRPSRDGHTRPPWPCESSRRSFGGSALR